MFWLQLKNLCVLEVHDIPSVMDDSIIEIVRHCPKLRTLNLALCRSITDRTVDFIARRGFSMKKLYLASCNVTNQGTIVMIYEFSFLSLSD